VVQDKTKTRIEKWIHDEQKKVKDFYLMLVAQNFSKYDAIPTELAEAPLWATTPLLGFDEIED